jgi:hypothetical protein
MSGLGRPCVKTHTSTKCRKYNSPTRYRTVWAQHDSTLTTRNYSEIFYARRGPRSFHTASVIRVMGDETDPLFPLLLLLPNRTHILRLSACRATATTAAVVVVERIACVPSALLSFIHRDVSHAGGFVRAFHEKRRDMSVRGSEGAHTRRPPDEARCRLETTHCGEPTPVRAGPRAYQRTASDDS